jgi:hypothetical protein
MSIRPSRWYQNRLQLVARGSTVFLFFSGSFLVSDEVDNVYSLIFLLFTLLTGYVASNLKFRRFKSLASELKKGEYTKLKPSRYYQKWLQLSSRGKDTFVFFLGLLLGKGYVVLSFILLGVQLINGLWKAELSYLIEKAIVAERFRKRKRKSST